MVLGTTLSWFDYVSAAGRYFLIRRGIATPAA
jgi:hypothetical protein